MFELVIGGSGSGKSAYAEKKICSLAGKEPLYYIATMLPFGEETGARIQKHRNMREGKGFITKEWYSGISRKIQSSDFVNSQKQVNALLECVSNLTANEIYSEGKSATETICSVCGGIEKLNSCCRNLVVVTNDVFADSVSYTSEMIRFKKILGEINRILAQKADRVTEIIWGCERVIKGEKGKMKKQGKEKALHIITGGAYQGKTEFAGMLYPKLKWTDGTSADLEEGFREGGILSFHTFIRRWIRSGYGEDELIRKVLSSTELSVIVCDETGCGLVPTDPFERRCREAAGYIMTRLCKEAGRVDRMVCGIAEQLK